MFIDEVDIIMRAGKGGDGCMAFLREKYRPMGGPAGGNGGRGASVILQSQSGIRTLVDFTSRRIIVAKNGEPGSGRNKSGKSMKNLVIKVPIGTIIRDRDTGNILGDLTENRQKIIIARGGKGGRGNASFATSINRAPRNFEKGEPGEERNLTLELRLLADVGLVGLPNAGKSTLIGAVSTVKPKVANYEFTTLRPSVGVVRLGDYASFTMADIPGLIELAHEGKGLGHQFLRHIKRTEIICHLIEIPLYPEELDGKFEKMVDGYRIIRNELAAYDEELARKPEVVCWTKADILDDETMTGYKCKYLAEFENQTGCALPVFVISAVRGDSTGALLGKLAHMLELDMTGSTDESEKPEYVDGEPPEHFLMSELSMETLDEEVEKGD